MTELGMFAKHWEPGKVKTRLASSIGTRQASHLYRLFIECLMSRFADVAGRRLIVTAPAGRHRDFQRLPDVSHWELRTQSDGDLGRRMHRFLESRFRDGARRVALIGSDIPDLPVEFVIDSFQMLSEHEVVIGPSGDGGYYLIAMSRLIPAAFRQISWSTDSVFQQTASRLSDSGIRFGVLPEWNDVDNLDDLRRILVRLESSATDDARLEKLRQQIAGLVGNL